MGALVLDEGTILVGQFNISPFTGGLTLGEEVAALESKVFGGGRFLRKTPGIKSYTQEFTGYADFASGGVSVSFTPAVLGDQFAVSTMLDDGVTEGDTAIFSRARLLRHAGPTGPVGELAAFQLGFGSDAAQVHGVVGMPQASYTTSGFTGTGVQLGAVGASQKLYAALHVNAATGTDLAVKIQSDDNSGFTSATDRITFSTVSAVGWQWATPVSGAITDDYWRVVATVASNGFDACCVFGIL